MPSSLFPSRCAFASVSIPLSSLDLVSIKCSRSLPRNSLRFDSAALLGMTGHLLLYIHAGHMTAEIVGQSFIDMDAHELAGRGLTAQKHRAVDFRRLRLHPPAHSRSAPRNRTFN